jgi:threonine dehydratase
VCKELCDNTGAHFIHPHNDYAVMAGQGTIGMEMLSQCPNLDAIVVPLGGGGMAGGIATYVHAKNSKCKGCLPKCACHPHFIMFQSIVLNRKERMQSKV